MAGRRTTLGHRGPTVALLLAALAVSGLHSPPPIRQDEGQGPEPARSLADPRLGRLREASAAWELRRGPRREVVDLVCLVPDLPTFLEAIGRWDERHVVPGPDRGRRVHPEVPPGLPAGPGRPLSRAGPIRPRARRSGRRPCGRRPGLDGRRRGRRPGRPAARRASTAGRRASSSATRRARRSPGPSPWPPAASSRCSAGSPAAASTTSPEPRGRRGPGPRPRGAGSPGSAPRYERLGDDCDFLTLALDLPYRYEGKGIAFQAGPAAFDDLIGRHLNVPRDDLVRLRWAFTGRLVGDATRSAYAAMCSLFLRPERALDVQLLRRGRRPALVGLPPRAGRRAARAADGGRAPRPATRRACAGWHEAFDPIQPGRARADQLRRRRRRLQTGDDAGGRTWDVPLDGADGRLHDPQLLGARTPATSRRSPAAGWPTGPSPTSARCTSPTSRSFRAPELLADLLAEGLPFVAAARILPEELPPIGNCWRLVYLGDPLFAIDPAGPPSRLDRWAPADDWPTYDPPGPPPSDGDAFALLSWSTRVAIDAARRGAEPPPRAGRGPAPPRRRRPRRPPSARSATCSWPTP